MTSMWPDNFGSCMITGQYLTLAGLPVEGSLTLNARPPVLIDYDRELVILPRSITIVLDNTGSFSQAIPATDDPDISPFEWTYTVTETFAGGRTYDIEAPLGQTVDISKLSPTPASTGNPIVRGPRGFAGGVQKVQGRARDENDNVDLTGVVPVLTDAGWSIASAAEFRAALGLGSAATHNDSDYSLATEYSNAAKRNQNLGDLSNFVQARENLGLAPAQIRATLGLTDAWTNTEVVAKINELVAAADQRRVEAVLKTAQGFIAYKANAEVITSSASGNARAGTDFIDVSAYAGRIVRIVVKLETEPGANPSAAVRRYVMGPGFTRDQGWSPTNAATVVAGLPFILGNGPGLRGVAHEGHYRVPSTGVIRVGCFITVPNGQYAEAGDTFRNFALTVYDEGNP